jgi:hypothetical protein
MIYALTSTHISDVNAASTISESDVNAFQIVDAAFPNSIRMAAKWDLVTAAKHFHQRRGIGE